MLHDKTLNKIIFHYTIKFPSYYDDLSLDTMRRQDRADVIGTMVSIKDDRGLMNRVSSETEGHHYSGVNFRQ